MQKKQKTNTQIIKDIESGKYRDCYLMYNRKSMDEAESQKNSITYQQSENARSIEKSTISIAQVSLTSFCANGVIAERHSGFKEDNEIYFTDEGQVQYRIDRPKFLQMAQYLNAGYFKGVVCLCWDRLSRNKADDTVIRKLMRNGIDVQFAYVNYDNSSSGELHMDIDGMFAQHHSRVTSEKVRASTKENRRAGICTYRAPIGYLNEGKMDRKPIDPVRGPIIAEMFKLYATGNWSLSDLACLANEQGMTTVPMRRRRTKKELLADEQVILEKTTRPIVENHVSRILRNRFYTGMTLDEDGGYVLSISHEALVDDVTFNRVQARLSAKTVSVQYAEKLDHPMRGLIRCAECRRVYTPYVKKGILYFNARCLKTCTNTRKNCNFAFVSNVIKEIIQNIHFTADELDKLNARTGTEISLLEERRNAEIEQLERKRKRIRGDQAYLRSERVSLLRTGVFSPEDYANELEKLKSEYDSLLEKEGISEAAMRDLMQDVATLSELLNITVPVYENANPHEKEKIARTIFSELFISQDVVEYKLHRGFEPFADRFFAVCDPIAWLSELFPKREAMQLNITKLKQLLSA